jgi:hypothetical protein
VLFSFFIVTVFFVSFCGGSSCNNRNHSIPYIAKRTKIPSTTRTHTHTYIRTYVHTEERRERKKEEEERQKRGSFFFFFFFFSAFVLHRPSHQPDVTGATRLELLYWSSSYSSSFSLMLDLSLIKRRQL